MPAAIENDAVVSPLPTMIFGGEFESIAGYGRLAAQTLSHSSYFLFPGQGHGEIYGHYDPDAPGCGTRMMAEFFADPTHAPDDSCLAALPPLHFLGT